MMKTEKTMRTMTKMMRERKQLKFKSRKLRLLLAIPNPFRGFLKALKRQAKDEQTQLMGALGHSNDRHGDVPPEVYAYSHKS